MEWIVPAELDEWDELSDKISELLKSYAFNNSDIISFVVALEEIFVNIASYAYMPPNGLVSVKVNILEKTVKVQFCDNGKPFNPLSVTLPAINAISRQREIGGLGIYMARTKSDDMIYEYKNNENRLTLIKKFD